MGEIGVLAGFVDRDRSRGFKGVNPVGRPQRLWPFGRVGHLDGCDDRYRAALAVPRYQEVASFGAAGEKSEQLRRLMHMVTNAFPGAQKPGVKSILGRGIEIVQPVHQGRAV